MRFNTYPEIDFFSETNMKKLSTFFLLAVFSFSTIAIAQDDAAAPTEATQPATVNSDVDTQDSPSDATAVGEPVPMEVAPAAPMSSVVGSDCGCGAAAPVAATPVISYYAQPATCTAACRPVPCCTTKCVTKCSTKRVRTKPIRVRTCRPRRCRCR